jgi:hypothetical protein
MNFVFDLDETLVATKKANYEAYLSIGVVPPEDFWKTPWESYCSKAVHDKKQSAFKRELMLHGDWLPCYELLKYYGGQIITNASDRSVEIVTEVFPPLRRYKITNNLSHDKKIDWLQNAKPIGVYWDDQCEFIKRVREETKWQAIDVSGL